MDQLFRTVQGISSVVSNLTGRLDNLTDRLDNQSQSQLPTRDRNQTNPSQTDIKDLIRKEITEMHEREKRKHSIIIRGINYSQDDFQTNFNLITNNIINRNVRLTNIKPLKPNIVRADIDDADLRKQLLLNASKLKSNQLYAHIFISRDLTYNQRTELRERRLGRVTMTGANAVPVSSNLSPTSTNSHSGLDLHTTVAPTAPTPSSPSPSLTLNTRELMDDNGMKIVFLQKSQCNFEKKSKIFIDGLKFGYLKKFLRFVLSLRKQIKLKRFCILLAK